MSKLFTYKSAALLAVLSLTAAVRSNAQETSTTSGAVFVMTNSNTRNEILQFVRNPNGSLYQVGQTPTGGNGSGGTTDPLASQNSLLLTSDSRFLLAVNAASGTISSFAVFGAFLNTDRYRIHWRCFPRCDRTVWQPCIRPQCVGKQ